MKKSKFLYQNKILKVLLFLFITFIFISCQENKQSSFFTKINIKIPIDGVKNIKDCAKWYVNFSRIKRAVIYKDRIICCGWNGGFACLNVYNFKRDVVLENKMNTDFYTNIAVFQDTLFTEKFDKLYYWNSDTWVEYPYPLPIRYFDILYEDDTYVFHNYSMGEWGSILFVYNKKTKVTRGVKVNSELNTILKTDSGYLLSDHFEIDGKSYIIKNFDELKVTPDSLILKKVEFDDYFDSYSYSFQDEFKKYCIPFEYYYQNNEITTYDGKRKSHFFTSTFFHNGKLFHIVYNRFYGKELNFKIRMIGTIVDDTLRIIDTLQNCYAKKAYQFGNNTLIEEYDSGKGFTLIRNDTIYKISYINYHPNYHGKQIGDFCIPPKEIKKLTHNIEDTLNINLENDYKAKKGQPKREIEFVFNNKYKIIGHEGNGVDGIYIEIDNKRNKLQFMSQRSFLYNIFVYDNRLFLNFARNIGIIELTNIEKFVDKYKM